MVRRILWAGLLTGLMALTPLVANAQPRDNARYSASTGRNIDERGNLRARDSFAFRARHGSDRWESPRFFTRSFSRFGRSSSWSGDRYDRRR